MPPTANYKEILLKYRVAFSQPHIAKLMSSLPTYMILDDHEIEDNWPANRNKSDDFLYTNAINAYELYQASHGPAHELCANGQINRKLEKYWYQFTDGDIEWFVTDSRTRRNLAANDRRILDIEQEQALCTWLINSPARVKFVVTSVMFYPDSKRQDNDAWKGFPEQRLRLLETIRTHAIKNVIFISGDVHGSLTSRLTHSEDPDFEVHTIVSSPLCNSKLLPYAKASTFILDQPLARTAAGDYRHELTSEVISQDNFAHLIVDSRTDPCALSRPGWQPATVDQYFVALKSKDHSIGSCTHAGAPRLGAAFGRSFRLNTIFQSALEKSSLLPTYSYSTWPSCLLSVGVAMMQPCRRQQ